MLAWHRERVGDSGLLDFDHMALTVASHGYQRVFIDHPGLGWHNFDHPGLDRDGTNAALNMFYLGALQSWAGLLARMGDADQAQAAGDEASTLAATIEGTFYDCDRGVYADGLVDGVLSNQISQQTNAPSAPLSADVSCLSESSATTPSCVGAAPTSGYTCSRPWR